MRTINKGLGSNTFRQYGTGKSGRTAEEVLASLSTTTIQSIFTLLLNGQPLLINNQNILVTF